MKAHCTTIDSRAFGLAAGTTAAGVSALCALLLAVAPAGTRRMLGLLVHSDLSGLAINLTWSGALLGAVCWGIGVGLIFAAAAELYNRFSGAGRAEHSAVEAHGVA